MQGMDMDHQVIATMFPNKILRTSYFACNYLPYSTQAQRLHGNQHADKEMRLSLC